MQRKYILMESTSLYYCEISFSVTLNVEQKTSMFEVNYAIFGAF